MNKEHVKICFEFKLAESSGTEVETMWAIPHSLGFELDSIPFYVKGFALGDIVSIKKVNSRFYVDKLISASGHSTVQLWISNPKQVTSIRNSLKAMGCASELSDQSQLIGLDIPPNINYELIKPFLEDGQIKGLWDYQEACLGFL